MSQQLVNIGAVAGDGTGDPGRTAFNKVNANFTEVYNNLVALFGTDSGAANAYVVTLSPAPSVFTPVAGTLVRFNANNVNTGAATANVGGSGVKSILAQNGVACTGGEIGTSPTWLQYTGVAWQVVGTGATPDKVRTAAEVVASILPVNYFQAPGQVSRQGNNPTPGTTDMAPANQASLDSLSALQAVSTFTQENTLGKPLLLRASNADSMTLSGSGRVTSLLTPNAADIKQAPQNVNCLIFNQKNAGDFHLVHGRTGPDAHVYTGKFVSCIEGGGGDASGQAAFSWVIDDWFHSFSSNNSGYYNGGFSNLRVSKFVFEVAKSYCFGLQGVGNGDQQYIGGILLGCYDAFINGDLDTLEKALIQVDTLSAYSHQRGPVLSLTTLKNSIFKGIIVEPDAANVGGVGIAKFTDCVGIQLVDCQMVSRSGVPRGACAVELVNSFTGSLTNIRSDAVDGLRVNGTGALDLRVVNCDFRGCDNAFIQSGGTLSGKIVFIGCNLSDAQKYNLITQAGTASYSIEFIDSDANNAGLNATATNRNMDLTTSGDITLTNALVGRDTVSAAADDFFKLSGTGTFRNINPRRWKMAPPVNILDAASTQAILYDGIDSGFLGMPAFTPSLGGTTTYTVQFGRYNINGRRLHFEGQITVNAIGTGSASVISGLPFASANVANSNGGGLVYEISGSNVNITAALTLLIGQNATTMTLKGFTAAAAADGTINAMANGTNIRFQGSYPLP